MKQTLEKGCLIILTKMLNMSLGTLWNCRESGKWPGQAYALLVNMYGVVNYLYERVCLPGMLHYTWWDNTAYLYELYSMTICNCLHKEVMWCNVCA